MSPLFQSFFIVLFAIVTLVGVCATIIEFEYVFLGVVAALVFGILWAIVYQGLKSHQARKDEHNALYH